jgi:lysophospholipase L1-like esterase
MAALLVGVVALTSLTIGTALGAWNGPFVGPADGAPSHAGGPAVDPSAVTSSTAAVDPRSTAQALSTNSSPQSISTGTAASDAGAACQAPVPSALAVARAAAAQVAPKASRAVTPLAAFLGDSYTSGWNGSGLDAAGWPAIVASTFHWRSLNVAVAGTGFVNPGWTGQPVRTRVGEVIRAQPSIVFLAAGHNDRRFDTGSSATAADAVIDRLRSSLPGALLVVIGPIWQDGSPAASLQTLRDHLRRKAAAVGAIFIDPLGGGWFAGSSHRFIGPDGIHPTDAGHRHIAQLVLAALRSNQAFSGAGLTPAAAPAATPQAATPTPPADTRPTAATPCWP